MKTLFATVLIGIGLAATPADAIGRRHCAGSSCGAPANCGTGTTCTVVEQPTAGVCNNDYGRHCRQHRSHTRCRRLRRCG